MNARIWSFIKSHSYFLSRVYFLMMDNRIRGRRKNSIQRGNAFLSKSRISFHGTDNHIIIGSDGEKPAYLKNLKVSIYGSNKTIIIEGGVGAKDLSVYCADAECFVHILEGTQISGKTELAVMEGTSIIVGRDCLFSANITLRAGDSHSVIDEESGKRINPSKNIIIGNRVWIGNTVIVTKGSNIGADSVIATGSVVTGKVFPDHSAIGGNPARVIKEGISWIPEKI